MLYHLQFLAKAWGPLRLFSSHTFLASFGAALAAVSESDTQNKPRRS